MAEQALSIVSVIVNNEVVSIKPNSFSFTEGFGERKVRAQSAGPGSTSNVTSEDIETQFSMCKFMLYTTAAHVNLVRRWQANFDQNKVTASDEGITRSFENAIIINNPEVNIGVDGEIEVEFQSDPAA